MIYGGTNRYVRHYVEVEALHQLDAAVVPLTIIWDDGRRLDIDFVENVRRTACNKTHGYALRYSVRIFGQLRYLYQDNQGWFVEVPADDVDPRSSYMPDPRKGSLPR